MATCPNCQSKLVQEKKKHSVFWSCPGCGGRAMSMAVLNRSGMGNFFRLMWQEARGRIPRTKRPCPMCGQEMVAPVYSSATGPRPDICVHCAIAWFSAEEFGRLAVVRREDPKPEKNLSERAEEAIAAMEAQTSRTKRRYGWIKTMGESNSMWYGYDRDVPLWKWILPYLGFPVDMDAEPYQWFPWGTWGMTVLVSLVSILAFFDLEKIVGLFGFIPAEAFRHGGLTFITPFCFHGGILHLVSNMYFLIILGDAAEEDLGWDKFLMVVIGSAILGCLTRLTFDYGSTIPGIGASGGVAALVTYYALKYPWHRFGVAIRVLFLPRLFIIPAVILAILWVLMQILLSYLQVIGFGSISGLDHLGGATGGMIAFLIWGRRPAKGQSPEKDPRPYGL